MIAERSFTCAELDLLPFVAVIHTFLVFSGAQHPRPAASDGQSRLWGGWNFHTQTGFIVFVALYAIDWLVIIPCAEVALVVGGIGNVKYCKKKWGG